MRIGSHPYDQKLDLSQSARSTSAGGVRLARMAGAHDATIALATTITGTMMNVAGSAGGTWYSSVPNVQGGDVEQ